MSRDAVSRAPSAEQAWRGLVEELRTRQQAIQVTMLAHIRALCGSRLDDQWTVRTVAAVVDYALTCIEQGEDWLEPVPSMAVAEARRAAQTGVGLDTVLLCYVAGHGALGEEIMDVADRSGLLSDGAALRRLRTIEEAVLERLIASIAHEYRLEHELSNRSPERRRAELVERLLGGSPIDAGELGYDLDAWHLCVIATGTNAQRAVRGLAAALGRELLLVVRDGAVWAWLGGQRKPRMSDVERVLSAPGFAGVSLAIGEAARGVDGWRLTHREAQAALLVAQHSPQQLTRYLDVALEAAALQDQALADSLIERYLLPLDDMRIGGQAARRTLRALFDSEYNVSSAAHPLKVHRSSVYRWREEIEKRLGYRLHEHQAEIEVALRIEDLRARHSA